ncbi:MAG TPA: hypothetical protein VNF74_04890 [Terriglobales bacterium]|nr:hypothetical protein [Terriglobales bacterium]
MRVVNGVRCIAERIGTVSCATGDCEPVPPNQNPNWTCASRKYGTLVHLDRITERNGEKIETIQDTYDFRPVAPDPAAMRVPSGFARRHDIPALPLGHR